MKFLRSPIILALLSTAMNTQAAPLDLDTTFDNDGMLSANYGAGTHSFFHDVEITPDDKIVAVGHAQKTDSTYDLLMVKYNLDGTLDNSFGTNGKVNLPVDVNTRGTALVIQPDGKLLVAGHALRSNNKWGVFVKRFNSDGSTDPSFTTYNYQASFSYGSLTGPRTAFAKDIAVMANGKILVSLSEDFYTGQTGSGFDTVKRSRLFRLQNNGSLDTSFGTNGFTVKSGVGNNYSYEDEKISLSDGGDIYVAGGRRELFYSQNNQTMRLSKYSANGSELNFGGSNEGWVRRANNAPNPVSSYIYQDRLYSSLVLPNGNIVSAGCIEAATHFKSRIQQQDNTGSLVNTFGVSGVIDSTMSTQAQRIEHCYRDVNYHPGVGVIAVGGIKNGPFSSHGSLYVSAVNAATGASIATQRLGTINEGYLYSTATTSGGKIVSVGYMNNPRESVIVMMEGAALPAPTNTLNTLSFTDTTGVAFSASQVGNLAGNIVITPSAALTARVFGGTAMVNSTTVSNPFTLNDGDSLSLGHTSASMQNTQVTTGVVVNSGAGFHRNNKLWKVGDTFGSFSSTTLVIDTTPDTFTYSSATNVALSSTVQSAVVTISGINSPASISVSAGSFYCINSSPCTDSNGTVNNGDAVVVRQTSAGGFSSNVTSTLTIGGVSGTFVSTTEAQDTTPNAFSFTATTAAERSTIQVAADITIAGINSAAPISINGGSYRINSGAYTSAAGTVNTGDTVTVRHTSSSSFSTAVTNTLTIGGVSAGFMSTTEAQDTSPNAFSFPAKTAAVRSTTQISDAASITGINDAAAISVTNGLYSVNGAGFTNVNGTVSKGNSVRVRHDSSSSFSTAVSSTLTIGGVSANFVSTTDALDTTPDAFVLQPSGVVPPAAVGSTQYSLIFTVAGINSPAAISISGGRFSINNLPYTNVTGTVSNGDTVRVSHTASSSFATSVTSSLTIGGVQDNFVSTTEAQDTLPNAFSFGLINGLKPLSTTLTSRAISITGINSAAPISVTNGEYSINGGAFTSANGTVANGASVRVRQVTSATFSTQKTTTLSVGGVFSNYLSTTIAQDLIPDAFSFTAKAAAVRNVEQLSNTITVAGINDASPISITNGEYSINGAAYTSANGAVSNGNTVQVRHTSSTAFGGTVSSTLTIGGVDADFESTADTADTTPDALVVVAQTGVELSTAITSAAVTITGINTTAAISITGGEYSINGAAFTGAAGTVENGDELQLRHTSSASHATDVITELTIGGVVGTFKSTTKAADAPAAPAEAASGGGGGSIGLGFLFFTALVFLRRRIR